MCINILRTYVVKNAPATTLHFDTPTGTYTDILTQSSLGNVIGVKCELWQSKMEATMRKKNKGSKRRGKNTRGHVSTQVKR